INLDEPTGGITVDPGSVSGATETINLDVKLGATQTWTLHSSASLNLNGTLSGAGDVTLVHQGQGGAALTPSGNNNFTGSMSVGADLARAAKGNNPMGTADGGTEIMPGGFLDFIGSTDIQYSTPEPVTLRSQSTARAVLQNFGHDTTFAGPITSTHDPGAL